MIHKQLASTEGALRSPPTRVPIPRVPPASQTLHANQFELLLGQELRPLHDLHIVAQSIHVAGRIIAAPGVSIRLEARTVSVTGQIEAGAGRDGRPASLVNPMHADAIANHGQRGGDIVVIADETLHLAGLLRSGDGGVGGCSSAESGAFASSCGGNGGNGGDVTLRASRFELRGQLQVAHGGQGGSARARGGPSGSQTIAQGGNGGDSGLLTIDGPRVNLGLLSIRPGNGGAGADATVSLGSIARKIGLDGSSVSAIGGNGGNARAGRLFDA